MCKVPFRAPGRCYSACWRSVAWQGLCEKNKWNEVNELGWLEKLGFRGPAEKVVLSLPITTWLSCVRGWQVRHSHHQLQDRTVRPEGLEMLADEALRNWSPTGSYSTCRDQDNATKEFHTIYDKLDRFNKRLSRKEFYWFAFDLLTFLLSFFSIAEYCTLSQVWRLCWAREQAIGWVSTSRLRAKVWGLSNTLSISK